MKLHKHFYVAVVILAVTGGAGEVYFRWLVKVGMGEVVRLNMPLSEIPRKLGGWQGYDEPINASALLKIGAQDTLRRYYLNDRATEDTRLDLYVAYFGGVRGRAPHRPTECMPGAGFSNVSNERVSLKVPGFGQEPLRVHKDVFEHRSGEKKLVVWWEYVHGENVASRTLQRLRWVLPGFLGGRRGSVLQVQVMHNLKTNVDVGMSLVTEFMNQLGPHIQEVLPGEKGDPDASG